MYRKDRINHGYGLVDLLMTFEMQLCSIVQRNQPTPGLEVITDRTRISMTSDQIMPPARRDPA